MKLTRTRKRSPSTRDEFARPRKRDLWERTRAAREERVGLALLPRQSLVKTGPFDHADWNYEGLLGYMQRQRYHLVRRLLRLRHVERILEVGYGSGAFLPELRKHCERLDGVDIHERTGEVTQSLQAAGVSATLHTASTEDLPFEGRTFDAVVAVSTLEFVGDITRAVREMSRVLRPSGVAIVVVPGEHPWLDLALWLATGENAKRDFGDRRSRVIPTLLREMRLDKRIAFPIALPGFPTVYTALRLMPPSAQQASQR
jgi:SAM-dependent methyltransferase